MPRKGQYAEASDEREIHRTIVHRIRERRHDLRLTQEELADLLTIPRPTLAGWERGRGYIPMSLAPMISRRLEIPIDHLFLTDEELEAARLRERLAALAPPNQEQLEMQIAALTVRLDRLEGALDSLRVELQREREEHTTDKP